MSCRSEAARGLLGIGLPATRRSCSDAIATSLIGRSLFYFGVTSRGDLVPSGYIWLHGGHVAAPARQVGGGPLHPPLLARAAESPTGGRMLSSP